MAKVRVINSGSGRERVLGKRRGDRAKHVVETAALDIEAGNGPAAFAGKPDDRVGDRLPVLRENAEVRLALIGRYLHPRTAGPLAQLGGDRGGIAGSEIEAHGVVIPRAGGEIGRRTVGEEPAAGGCDGGVATPLSPHPK